MASPSLTEQAYDKGESVGMAVSCSSIIPRYSTLADRVRIWSALVDCCLRYALLDLGLEHAFRPRGMSHSTHEANVNVLGSPFCLLPVPGLFRSRLS